MASSCTVGNEESAMNIIFGKWEAQKHKPEKTPSLYSEEGEQGRGGGQKMVMTIVLHRHLHGVDSRMFLTPPHSWSRDEGRADQETMKTMRTVCERVKSAQNTVMVK